MPLEMHYEKNRLTVLLSGEIDHHSAVFLRKEIDRALSKLRPPLLTLDFGGVTFMDDSAVGLVMGRHRTIEAFGGELEVTNLSPIAYRMMRLSNLHNLAKLKEKSVEHATKGVREDTEITFARKTGIALKERKTKTQVKVRLLGDITGNIANAISFLSDWELFYNSMQILLDILANGKESSQYVKTALRASEKNMLREIMPSDSCFVITGMNFNSPGEIAGFATVIGQLNPVTAVQESIKLHDERTKDKKYRTAQDKEDKELDLERKRMENERFRMQTNQMAFENQIQNLKSVLAMSEMIAVSGLDGFDSQMLLKTFMINPLAQLQPHIAEERLTAIEIREIN